MSDLPGAALERTDAVVAGGIPVRNVNFTGRRSLLTALERSLSARSRVSVLHGFGGVGKTQVAAEFAHRFADRYDLIWWIPAERRPRVLRSLVDLAARLGLPVSPDADQVAAQTIEALSESRLRWLLVYDNADEPDELAR